MQCSFDAETMSASLDFVSQTVFCLYFFKQSMCDVLIIKWFFANIKKSVYEEQMKFLTRNLLIKVLLNMLLNWENDNIWRSNQAIEVLCQNRYFPLKYFFIHTKWKLSGWTWHLSQKNGLTLIKWYQKNKTFSGCGLIQKNLVSGLHIFIWIKVTKTTLHGLGS